MLLLASAPANAFAAPDADDRPLIRAAIDAGRLHQARVMLIRLSGAADSIETEALWAQFFLAEGRNEDALRAFDMLAARAPDSCAFQIGGGIAAARSGKADRAILSIERAAGRCALGWEAWNALGLAFDAARRWDASASAYAHALALRPSRPSSAVVLHNIGASMLLQQRFQPAAEYLQAALRLAPGNVRIIDDLDAARASIGKAPVRNMAVEDAARWAERLDNAGHAAMRAGRTSDARALLTEAITTSPTYQPDAAFSLAELQSRR
jgi:Flp pilus assembly protein TadD